MIDKDLIDSLQSTGIIDGYEYTLRKLVQDQLPTDNVYEKCAYYLLEYEKMYKKDNLRAKNLQEFVKMGEEKEEEKKQKTLQEIIPNYKVTLRSKIILERDMKTKNNELKVFETNIDELIKNRIQLSSHKLAMEEMERRQTNYGSFAAFALNENEKLRNYNFTTAPNFEPFEFIPILEIRKMNEMNNNNDMNNFKNEDSRKGTIRSLSKVDDDNITDSSKRYGTEEGKSNNYKYTNSEKRNMMGESHEFVDDVIKSSKKEFDGKSSNVNNESEDVKSSYNNRTSNQNDNQSESQKSESQKSKSQKSQSKKSQSRKSESQKSQSKISQSKISQSKKNDNTENNNDGEEEGEGNDDES